MPAIKVGTATSAGISRVYAAIARELARTWRVQYLTSARPGDRIEVNASVVGEGSAAQTLKIKDTGSIQAPPPSSLVPKGAYGPGGPLGVAVAVGFLVLIAVLFFLAGMRGSWVRSRIAPHTGEAKGKNSRQKRKQRRSEALAAVFGATERALGNLKQWRWVQRMLEQGSVPLRTVEFFWIMIGSALGLALLAALAGQHALVIMGMLLGGAAIPFVFVWLKMRRRLRAFEDQLPDLLITIAASLKAGHSFKQGLQAVVDEGPRNAPLTFLLVHGNPTWGYLYREFIRRLSPRYRVIAPDHVGFGRSDKPRDPRWYTLDRRFARISLRHGCGHRAPATAVCAQDPVADGDGTHGELHAHRHPVLPRLRDHLLEPGVHAPALPHAGRPLDDRHRPRPNDNRLGALEKDRLIQRLT